MKKIIVSIILMAAGIAATTHGQTSIPVSRDRFPLVDSVITTNGIIREQDLAYYEVDGVGRFIHVYLFGNVYEAKVPVGWHVKDFRVLNDTVYFCGIDSSRRSALLGYFSAATLLADGGTIQYHLDTLYGGKMSILNRLAVKQDKITGKVSLMAIGLSTPGVDPERFGANSVVYYNEFPYGSSKCIFNTDNEEMPQLFWDVVPTRKYFTIIGTYTFTESLRTNIMVLRNVLIGTTTSNFLASIKPYKWYECPYMFLSGIRAAHLADDSIALASYCDMGTDLGLQVFTIDALTGQMTVNQNNGIGSIPTDITLPPSDMAYQPGEKALMLIDTLFVSGSNALRINPYLNNWMDVSPYYFRYENRPRYTSIVAVPPDAFMMASGGSWLLLKPGFLPPPMRYNRCIGSFTYDIFKQDDIGFEENESGDSYNIDIKFQTSSSGIAEESAPTPCEPWVYPYYWQYDLIPDPIPTK